MMVVYGHIFALCLLQLYIEPGFGTEWIVTVNTADESSAGTDSTIEIEIFGTYGHMSKETLQGSFERGDYDTTTFYKYFGEPYRIKVYHSGRGWLPSAWKLNKITIRNGYTGQEYVFPCYCWLDAEEKSISGNTRVCKNIPNCLSGYKECGTSIYNPRCNKCYKPYYSGGWGGGCVQCPSIDKCTDRYCSTKFDTKCTRCEDNRVFFKPSSDSRTCERLCAWNNHYCWPGTCGSGGFVKNCQCSSGFHLISHPSETSCQLSYKPSFETCATAAIGPIGEKKISKTSGATTECQYLTDFYGNYKPVIIQYDLLALYQVDTSPFPHPIASFIDSFNFGVSDVYLRVVLQGVTGIEQHISDTNVLTDTSLSTNVNMIFSDKGNITVQQRQLTNGDRLCLKYLAKGGGYLISIDTSKTGLPRSQPQPYQKTTSTKTICYLYDDTEPQHCQENSHCSSEPLELETRVSRTPNIKVQWQGWTDSVPAGGQPHHASSIESYQITVNEVSGQIDALKVDKNVVFTKKVNALTTELALSLTSQKPKLFCVTLEVKDFADNIKQARRFFLYDNETNISTRIDKKFYVKSASVDTNYTWQTHHNDICLSWYDHFYNKFYLDNPLLSRILPDQFGLISGVYEQNTGILPVSGTPNVYGITRFLFSAALDNASFSTEIEIPDFQKQQFCKTLHLYDGDTYRLNIRAVDIANNTFAEVKRLYIDRSVPHIENIELVKDGYRKLYILNQTDLSKTNLQFDAFDSHSGIETVEWFFGITDHNNSLDSGAIGVNRGNCETVKDCYCPKIGEACEVMKYSIPLNSLVHKLKHISNHNDTYFFTIKATNKAKLFNIEHMDVLIDNSPPEPGVIQEDVAVSAQDASSAPSLKTILEPVFGTIAGLVLGCMALVLVCIKRKRIIKCYRKKVKCFSPETKSVFSHIHVNSVTSSQSDRPFQLLNFLPATENVYEQSMNAVQPCGESKSSRVKPTKRQVNESSLEETPFEFLQGQSYGQIIRRTSRNTAETATDGIFYEELQKQITADIHPYGDAKESSAEMQKGMKASNSLDNSSIYQPQHSQTDTADHVYGKIDNTSRGQTDQTTNVSETKSRIKAETGQDNIYANLIIRP